MLKIYANREREIALLPLLAEFKARVITSFPIKGRTRKIKGKNAYKVINFPILDGKIAIRYREGYVENYLDEDVAEDAVPNSGMFN